MHGGSQLGMSLTTLLIYSFMIVRMLKKIHVRKTTKLKKIK